MMTYYQPPDFYLVPFSYKGITVTVTATDDLESYLEDGWQVARDYQIASVKDKLADVLDELEHEYLNRQRAGSPLPIMGLDIIEKLEWYLSIKIPEDFFDVTTKKYYRKQYYTDLEETGTAYKTNDDRQAGTEWVGTVARDRLNVNDVIYEIFEDESEPASKIKKKIKIYMNSLDGWKYQKKVYFGKRQTSGFIKKH